MPWISRNPSLQWVSWRYYTPRSSSFHASVIHSFSQSGVYEPSSRDVTQAEGDECHIQSVNYWGHFTTVPAWGVDFSEHESGAHSRGVRIRVLRWSSLRRGPSVAPRDACLRSYPPQNHTQTRLFFIYFHWKEANSRHTEDHLKNSERNIKDWQLLKCVWGPRTSQSQKIWGTRGHEGCSAVPWEFALRV